jgi:hypothetical protein
MSASVDGGHEPVWSPAGDELFYRSGTGMMAVEIQADPFSLSPPHLLFETSDAMVESFWRSSYDVSSADGLFVMIENVADGTEIVVVLNLLEELKRLVPTEN